MITEVIDELEAKAAEYYTRAENAFDEAHYLSCKGVSQGIEMAVYEISKLLTPRMTPTARTAYEAYVDTLDEPATMKAPGLDGNHEKFVTCESCKGIGYNWNPQDGVEETCDMCGGWGWYEVEPFGKLADDPAEYGDV